MITSNIAVIMQGQKMTIHELASLSGVSAVTINKARQNRGILKCRLETLARIAAALEVPLTTLFAGEYKLGSGLINCIY